jgi:TP901 family phage tail tape measure protein
MAGAAQSVGSVIARIEGDESDLVAAVAKSGKALRHFAGMATRASESIGSMGRKLSLFVTGPMVAFGYFASRQAREFDLAMTESTSIMANLTEEMRGQLRKQALALSEHSRFTAAELARGYYYMTSAGLDAVEALKSLPTVAAFAQAGLFDLDKATVLLAQSQAALGMRSKDVEVNLLNMTRVSNALVQANILSQGTVEEFAEALTHKSAAALRLVGKDMEEGLAVLMAYHDAGVRATHAGEMMYIMLRDLQRASFANREMFQKFGVEVFNSQGAITNVGEMIGQLEKALMDLSPEGRRAALTLMGFQERSRAAVEMLIGFSGKIQRYESILRGAGDVTQKVADKQLSSFDSKIKMATHALNQFVIVVGEQILPKVIAFLTWLTQLVAAYQALGPSGKAAVKALAAMAFLAGPTLKFLSGQIHLWGVLIPSLHQGAKAYHSAAVALKAFRAAGMIGLGGAALAGVAGIVGLLSMVKQTKEATATEIQSMEALKWQDQNAQAQFGMSPAKIKAEMIRRRKQDLAARAAAEEAGRKPKTGTLDELSMLTEEERNDTLRSQAAFLRDQEAAILDRLDDEKKLNFLLERRKALEQAFAKADITKRWQTKQALLSTEEQIAEILDSQKELRRDDWERLRNAPQYAGAIEKGSLESYSAEHAKAESPTQALLQEQKKEVRISEQILSAARQAVTLLDSKGLKPEVVNIE